MNSKSRSVNVKINAIIGLSSQMAIMLLSFINRTVFIKLLGIEYLGVNGLYSSILYVLSLSELGIGNVMLYTLYKPVVEKDEAQINALLNYYKKIYRIIAASVLTIGFIIIPFLDTIVKSDLPYDNLVLYYILFLLNSVVTYFVAYKTALINADQRNYISKLFKIVFTLIEVIAQIVVLIITKNYILYLCIQILVTILNNLCISLKVDKIYPFIKKPIVDKKIDKIQLRKVIKSMFLYKMGVVIMNNTDNILISMIAGAIYVGYYSNYLLLINVVTTFINIIIQSLITGIGNLNATENKYKSYKFFNSLLIFFHWLAAFCAICFFLVFNDFISVWIGKSYLLGTGVLFAIVFNFYVQNVINPVWMYRETMGLFVQVKYTMLIAAIINLILSIILGNYFGLAGIIISTTIARILTTVWYEPRMLYRIKFLKPVRNYWFRQLKYVAATIMATLTCLVVSNNLPISLAFVFAKMLISLFITCLFFLITSFKSEEFILLRGYVINLVYKAKQL